VKVNVLHDSDLIDAKCSVVPAVRDAAGECRLVADETVRRVDADDGGFDGNGLPVLEDCLGEADCEMRFAGSVCVIVGYLAEKSVTAMEFDSSVEMNVAAECGTELIAGVDAVGIQRASE
jgi:hypothetical protein